VGFAILQDRDHLRESDFAEVVLELVDIAVQEIVLVERYVSRCRRLRTCKLGVFLGILLKRYTAVL